MRKRRTLEKEKIIYKNNSIKISQEINGTFFFEIGNEVTSDAGEAVAMMMKTDIDNQMWEVDIKCNLDSVSPDKSLYWLSGGDKEWTTLEHYNISWSECYLDFQEEFGFIVINILKNSKKLKDIRNGFLKYLNLPTLYEFAISRNLIK